MKSGHGTKLIMKLCVRVGVHVAYTASGKGQRECFVAAIAPARPSWYIKQKPVPSYPAAPIRVSEVPCTYLHFPLNESEPLAPPPLSSAIHECSYAAAVKASLQVSEFRSIYFRTDSLCRSNGSIHFDCSTIAHKCAIDRVQNTSTPVSIDRTTSSHKNI